jgi:drug/metabolite transporter (DMT)-like permease
MTTNDITLLSWLYVLAAIVSSIFVALALEKRLKIQMPATRPYRWGFYVGSMGLACAPLALFFGAATIVAGRNDRWEGVGYCSVITVFFALHVICGWFIIRRTRWAWVIGTIFSCNIFVWVINFIYGRNRWKEFGSQSGDSATPELQTPASTPHRSLTKQQKIVLGVAALVVALFVCLSFSAEVSRSGSQAPPADILIYTVIGTVLRFMSPIGIISVTILGFLFYRYRQPRDIGTTKDDGSRSDDSALPELQKSVDVSAPVSPSQAPEKPAEEECIPCPLCGQSLTISTLKRGDNWCPHCSQKFMAE